MSCESVHEDGTLCTIPGRHEVTHGYQDDGGQWVFWEEAVHHVSTRHTPTVAESTKTAHDITQPIPSPAFPAGGGGTLPDPAAAREQPPGADQFIPGTSVLDGTHCPTCGQYSKVHQRTLSSASAVALIRIYMYRYNEGRDYVNVPELFDDNTGHRDVSKGKYWDLLEQMPGEGEDGFRLGWWRLTDLGRAFVRGEVTVPQHAHTFDDQRRWYSGESVSIRDALGTSFDYDDLISGPSPEAG